MSPAPPPAAPSAPRLWAGRLLLAAAALGAAFACAKLGGPGGPLAGLLLLPLALGLWLPRSLRSGAAFSLGALALATLAELGSAAPPVSVGVAPSLGALVLLGVIGLAALGSARRVGAGEQALARAEAERRRLRELLTEQPGLLLNLERSGRLRAAYGEAPPGVPVEALFRDGLAAAGEPGALADLAEQAFDRGYAERTFTPAAGTGRAHLRLRRTAGGELAGLLTDGSGELRRLEALTAERDKALAASRAKSRFLAGMSHELRTPLNAILGFSDVMRLGLFGPLTGRYAEYAGNIHESGRHLLDLINDVLDMSKIEADKLTLAPEPMDAKEPVTAALRLLRVQADEAGVALRAELPDAPLPVLADRRAVKQIVLNLVGNALKFTPRGGSTTLTLEAVDGALELVVADTGVGIAPEDLERLGRPYEQAGSAAQQAKGTGLGLSLARALAELHGGALTLESVLGEGTVITVRLPVLAEAPEPSAEPSLPSNVIPFAAGRG